MNKDKIWCIYFGLIPKLAWPLQIYEVSLTKVETMERLISKFIKKWLGVPNSLTNVVLYSSSTKLKLPTLSLVEEYKLGKNVTLPNAARLSRPTGEQCPAFCDNQSEMEGKVAVENAESALRIKEIIGTVANGKAGLGLHPQRWWSKESTANRKWCRKKSIILRKLGVLLQL